MVGMGNTLMRDDGAGVHAIRYLQDQHADLLEAEFIDAGTLNFTLTGVIEDADNLIVVDAAQMHAPAGSIRVFEGDDMDRFLNRSKRLSVHEVSLIDLLSIARLTNTLPIRRALIGIQPERVELGEQPTDPVVHAIPKVTAAVLELIQRWNA